MELPTKNERKVLEWLKNGTFEYGREIAGVGMSYGSTYNAIRELKRKGWVVLTVVPSNLHYPRKDVSFSKKGVIAVGLLDAILQM